MKQVVTYSELRSRRRCAYRGHLEYDELLTPRRRKAGFREGTIADAGMNALYLHLRDTGGYDIDAMVNAMAAEKKREDERLRTAGLFDEEWQEIEDRWLLLLSLAVEYVAYARANDPFERIITCQLAGQVPVLTGEGRASTRYDFRFKLDGLVVIGGQLWLLENKWWKNWDRNNLKALQMDEQSGMYLWGFREAAQRHRLPRTIQGAVDTYGLPVGVYYNIVRKKLPVVPALNKDGTTTKRKDIDTTYDVFLSALEDRDQDPADYAEILDILREKGNTFYYREAIYRNETELADIGRRIYFATRYVADGFTFKSPAKECTWDCPFWSLCLEWSDELLEQHFDRKERKHEEYDEELEEAA